MLRGAGTRRCGGYVTRMCCEHIMTETLNRRSNCLVLTFGEDVLPTDIFRRASRVPNKGE